jgi:hypothetical protein
MNDDLVKEEAAENVISVMDKSIRQFVNSRTTDSRTNCRTTENRKTTTTETTETTETRTEKATPCHLALRLICRY